MMHIVLCLKFGQLQEQMQSFEQNVLENNFQQFYFNAQDIVNQRNLTYFNAPLLLFPDYMNHQLEYSARTIASSLAQQVVIDQLKRIVINGNMTEQIWAQTRLNALQNELPDLNNAFVQKQQQFFIQYQNQLKIMEALSSKIDKYDSYEDLEQKLGADTYFQIQNHTKLSKEIPFTNPTMLSNTPKDVIFIFKQFQNLEVLIKTIYEVCTLFDRIWLFSFEEYHPVNIILASFNKSYLSVIQIQNNIELIYEKILMFKGSTNYIDLQFIDIIQNQIRTANQNYTYQFVEGQKVILVDSYLVFLIFSNDVQFISNIQQIKTQGKNVYLISKNVYTQFILQFNKFFDLIIQYQTLDFFLVSQLKNIIEHLQYCIIDKHTVFGHINNSIIFIKPVFQSMDYIGSIYKLYQYDINFIYNDVNWYDQVSRVIVIDQQFNKVIIDPFAQHSPPYTTINNQRKYQFQLQPIVFNHSELQFNYTGNIRTTINQVYDNIEDDLFTEKYITVYQIKTGYVDYNAIISMSNKALTMLSRVPFKECDQTLPEITLAKQQYSSHVSTQQFNLSYVRSSASSKCATNFDSSCVVNSDYFQVRKQVKEHNSLFKPTSQCAFSKPDKFNFHSGFEVIMDYIKENNLNNITGNISEFSSLMQTAYDQISSGQYNSLYSTLSRYLNVPQLFSTQKGVSKIESVVGLLQFLQIMLIPDTQDSTQNGFHIPRTDLKCEAKKQRKNEQISNFDFLIMLQIRILSLKSYGGYYRVSYTNLSNNFPCVIEDEFQWSWQLGS
ncbi:Conserved_hypothetical protein [Hexamita inflata]|uniref:Uncharacterized protein n=1 Tax=Hexamita inflata TaxID=28002 RepID=A0AA86TK32_9EUKA|nr:Conserved hypothetical protein [Hexamita inflata]